MRRAMILRRLTVATLFGLPLVCGWFSPAQAQTAPAQGERELLQRRCQFAYVLLWKKDFSGAQEQFRKVLQADPALDDARVGLGLALERADKTAEAVAEFEKVKADSPHYAAAAGVVK